MGNFIDGPSKDVRERFAKLVEKERIRLEKLKNETGFNEQQILALFTRFCNMDRDGDNLLSLYDLKTAVDDHHALVARVLMTVLAPRGKKKLKYQYVKKAPRLNFFGFVEKMAVFRKNDAHKFSTAEAKAGFLFDMYDNQHRGQVTVRDFASVLGEIQTHEEHSHQENREQLAQKMIHELNPNGEHLTREQFIIAVRSHVDNMFVTY